MKLEVLQVEDWPLLADAPGNYQYECQTTETSYIVAGSATVEVEGEPAVEIVEGDLVTVMPETRCNWNITEAIERHCAKG